MRSTIAAVVPTNVRDDRALGAYVIWRHRVELVPAGLVAAALGAAFHSRNLFAWAAGAYLGCLVAAVVAFRVGEWRAARYERRFRQKIARANARVRRARGWRRRWARRRRAALKRRQPSWVYDRLNTEGYVDWPGKANVLASRAAAHGRDRGVIVLRAARCFTRVRWALWWERARIPTAVLLGGRRVKNVQHRRVRTAAGAVWLLAWRVPYALLLGFLYPPLRLVGRDRLTLEAGLAVALAAKAGLAA